MFGCYRTRARSLRAFFGKIGPGRLRPVLVWSLIICCLANLLFLTQFGLNMRGSGFDLLLNFKARLLPQGKGPKESPVVVVAIDNYTLSSSAMAIPEFFQHRYYTRVIKALHQSGAKAVVLVRVLPRTLEGSQDPAGLHGWLRTVATIDMPVLSGVYWRPNQLVAPDLEYLAAMGLGSFGFLNLTRDGDAVVRRVPLRWPDCHGDLGCYSLSWLAAKSINPALPLPGDEILMDFDPRPEPFPVVSFLELYRQSSVLSPDEGMSQERSEFFKIFKDKLVLIGENNDLNEGSWPTPFTRQYGYGDTVLEITAQTVDSLLSDSHFRSFGFWSAFLFLFALSLFSLYPLLMSPRGGPYPFRWFPAFLTPLYILVGLIAFLNRFYLPVLPGVMALFLAQAVSFSFRAIETRAAARTSLTALGLYVNPTLAGELLKNPELLTRTGERREMTVFFSDLVGFTALAEYTSPEELVVALNRYFECMEPIISNYGGILDKYDGDSVMAFWGAPLLPRFDHAASGCLAALDQQEALARLNQQFITEGRHPMTTLMGLSTGSMVVGNIGTQSRLNYTVLGDAVNLAARLVPVNKIYQTQIIISERTAREAARSVELRTLDKITVSGRRESLAIYEVMAHKGQLNDQRLRGRDLFEKALRFYFEREFQSALGLFEEVLAYLPGDGPAELMCVRCRSFINTPPDDDWQGITAIQLK